MKISSLILIVIIYLTGCCLSFDFDSESLELSTIYITPYDLENSNENEVRGSGYVFPIGACMNFDLTNKYQIEINTDGISNVTINYYSHNCSYIVNQETYPLNELVKNFNFMREEWKVNQNVIFSFNNGTIPKNAIQFTYFYDQLQLKCSGPSYINYFTNRYNDGSTSYSCENGQPKVVTCFSRGHCLPLVFDTCNFANNSAPAFDVFC